MGIESKMTPSHDNTTPTSANQTAFPQSTRRFAPVNPGTLSFAMMLMARSAAKTIELRKVLTMVKIKEMICIAWLSRNNDVTAPMNDSMATMACSIRNAVTPLRTAWASCWYPVTAKTDSGIL